jgi:hypothetical protein
LCVRLRRRGCSLAQADAWWQVCNWRQASRKCAVADGLVARLCETCCVREREFWQLLEEVFGRVYGRSLSKDQRLPKLGDMTVVEALAAGEEPRVVWNVLCDQMDIPDSRRWGKDHNAPPLPAGR